jgi:hypothetical protein
MTVPYQPQFGFRCARVVGGKKRVGGSWKQFQWPYITTGEHEQGKSPAGFGTGAGQNSQRADGAITA